MLWIDFRMQHLLGGDRLKDQLHLVHVMPRQSLPTN